MLQNGRIRILSWVTIFLILQSGAGPVYSENRDSTQEEEGSIDSLMEKATRLRKQMEEDRKKLGARGLEGKKVTEKRVRETEPVVEKKGVEVSAAPRNLEPEKPVLGQRPEGAPPFQNSNTVAKPWSDQPEYFIEYGDVLEISVWRVPDLSRDVIVRPDGRISYPLVGEIQAVALTLTELDQEITRALAEFLRAPQVSVALKQFGGRKFIVLGEVKIPGVYRFSQNVSLLEALALAGGFMKYAETNKVLLIRGSIRRDPKVKVVKVNANKVLKHGMLTENITIQPNDVLYVTRGLIGNLNDFLNDVVSPTLQSMIDVMVFRSAVRTATNKRT